MQIFAGCSALYHLLLGGEEVFALCHDPNVAQQTPEMHGMQQSVWSIAVQRMQSGALLLSEMPEGALGQIPQAGVSEIQTSVRGNELAPLLKDGWDLSSRVGPMEMAVAF